MQSFIVLVQNCGIQRTPINQSFSDHSSVSAQPKHRQPLIMSGYCSGDHSQELITVRIPETHSSVSCIFLPEILGTSLLTKACFLPSPCQYHYYLDEYYVLNRHPPGHRIIVTLCFTKEPSRKDVRKDVRNLDPILPPCLQLGH